MTRIGFCATWQATDPNANSGYAFSIRRQLQSRDFQISDLFLDRRAFRWLFAVHKLAARRRGAFYAYDREPLYLASLAHSVDEWSRRERLDAIVCPTSLPITRYRGPVPTIFVTDQVFPAAVGHYWANVSERYRRLGMAQEREALAHCAAASFPSRWAVEAALRECGADPRRVHEIPWGANLYEAPGRGAVERMLHNRPRDECVLVFIGRDWSRKGGDLVLATVDELHKLGIRCRLTVVGALPPAPIPDWVSVVPFIDKQTAVGSRRFFALMAGAHLLFMPSRAEAFGQVYCEAAAFAIPSVARAVGGVPSIVRDSVNGILLQPEQASATEFAKQIAALWSDRDAYVRMALAARDEYERRLNWDRFGEQFTAVIRSVL
ncbi:MAG TPA: glycosyltransferase family 4 protein [Thermoanaerobaculia bacterium]|nr:glycosyltransferase family 4 protein [Thermoanaerobaculia bacterium]